MANELNYVNYDFTQLVQQLIDRVKLKDTWKDTYRSSTGEMLIELYAYVANLVLYYIERRAAECYLDTAQLKSSVVNIVRMLNYHPKRKVSATGKLQFSIAAPLTKKVFIPQYTECQTSAGVKFLTTEDVVIMPGTTSVVAKGIQGTLVTISQMASGALNAEYKIEDTAVEDKNIFVYVSGVLWEKVDSFINSINTSKHYRVIPDIDDTLIIRFGNNVFGMAPAVGQEILIKYIQSAGSAGNVYETGKITTLNSTIYDEDGKPVQVSVTNSDLFLGGDDEESIEEIRTEAPRVFKTGDRAVNREDYIAILENYPGIATANVWGENEENPPNYNMFNRVKLVILLEEWKLPSVTFKQQLSEFLYTKSMLTVKYEYVDPTIVDIIPVLRIKVEKTGSLSAVQSKVTSVLEDTFRLGTTAKLGVSKRIADLIHIVEQVSGVAYHYMVLDVKKTLDVPFDSFYTYGAYMPLLHVQKGSVRLYAGDSMIAYDNGTGGFSNVSSTYTVTGSINYTTGYVGVDISPNPPSGDEVYVRYNQDKDGDIVVSANQIARLYDVDIVSITYI